VRSFPINKDFLVILVYFLNELKIKYCFISRSSSVDNRYTFDTLAYMATTKKRINISISKELDNALLKLAKRDQMPQATKAEHLIRLAIETEEDNILNTIAETRDASSAKFVSHKVAWR
jgi:hypothetical protein